MKWTQYVCFEAGPLCNLGKEHKACPNATRAKPDRGLLSDEAIVGAAVDLYRHHGFRGLIAWHFYNEPLIYRDRIVALAEKIRALEPKARFCLWSNGKLTDGLDKLAPMLAGGQVHLTDYGGLDLEPWRKLGYTPAVHRWQLDKRLNPDKHNTTHPCRRVMTELIFDAWGKAHACCIDWRGEIDLGALPEDPLASIVIKYQALRDKIARHGRAPDAPSTCLTCTMGHASLSHLVEPVASESVSGYINAGPVPSPKPAREAGELVLLCVEGDDYSRQQFAAAHPDYRTIHAHNVVRAIEAVSTCGAEWVVVLKSGDRLGAGWADAIRAASGSSYVKTAEDVYAIRPAVLQTIDGAYMPRAKNNAQPDAIEMPIVRESATAGRPASDRQPNRRPAVAFVSYRVPEHRLRDHFKWNAPFYEESRAMVYVTTDKHYDGLPDYCRQLIYPEQMKVFNLAKTKNFAIRHAIECGHDVVIASDVDCMFSPDSWARCLAIGPKRGFVPHYRMIDTIATANRFVPAPKATGTVAMLADDWRRAHYNERCEGYGCDDAILLAAMRAHGIEPARDEAAAFYHVAHAAGTPQKEFAGRTDHWGRESGFNPENFAGNRGHIQHADWTEATWGLAGGADAAVVTVAMRIPAGRVEDWIKHNGRAIEVMRWRAIVVTDAVIPTAPYWVRFALYPSEMPKFSITKTKNFGIKLLSSGVIVSTDIDIDLGEKLMDAAKAIVPGRAICPLYYAVQKWGERGTGHAWSAPIGTMAAHWADWQRVRGYSEKMVAYGNDDGDVWVRLKGEGVTMSHHELPVWHIAHDGDTVEWKGRGDQWHRADGWNPRNNEHNRNVMHGPAWHTLPESLQWGEGR